MNNNSSIQENIPSRTLYKNTFIWDNSVYYIKTFPLESKEGGGWVAEVPSLGKNTFCATGDTEIEALESLNELRDIFESFISGEIKL